MATLVLTAVGTAVGGPLGGAIGAIAGRALDGAVFGGGGREGPRLKELAVTTSSYGTVLPRHFGAVRSAGTVIWSTELKEAKESSGGKGAPKVTTYSYSVSFAVALGCGPIARVGRIWADGNLLRGADGKLKVEGEMRFYDGADDQLIDPLIAADVDSDRCPAFRGIAYLVFEDLALADFGNRIPALTFEIFGTDGTISLHALAGSVSASLSDDEVDGMMGLSHDGGSYADLLQTVGLAWPLACDGSGGQLSIRQATAHTNEDVVELPAPVVGERDDFGSITGFRSERSNDSPLRQVCLRYYDVDRDFQPGLQRSRAQGGNGDIATLELPASISPNTARQLSDYAAMRRRGSREVMTYRIAELSEHLHPGAIVRVPDRNTLWTIDGWEWRHTGIELTLSAIPPALANGLMAQGSSGETQPPLDIDDGGTILAAFGLPWSGTGDSGTPALFAAAASHAAGWRGAALYADFGDGALVSTGATGRTPAIMGVANIALGPGSPFLVDRSNELIVTLANADMALDNASLEALVVGANRALLGNEIVQFAEAEPLGGGVWRLINLIRGRAGTEVSIDGHAAGDVFVLLDDRLITLDPALAGSPQAQSIVAIGKSDPEPVVVPISEPKAALRPYSPVHGRSWLSGSGSVVIEWSRRSRGSFAWLDEVDVPLNEASETYDIRFVAGGNIVMTWRSSIPRLEITDEWSNLSKLDGHFEVRQIGAQLMSPPLRIDQATAG